VREASLAFIVEVRVNCMTIGDVMNFTFVTVRLKSFSTFLTSIVTARYTVID
jgi:hypothetical protein